ncbi:hypothetical protein OOJ91_12055 [Micromonospora lupini]|uniref:hypothetical protein n=1 Tax=Micromonospora lupini TaxID=285679 RepID=UPI002258D707|nr:hypothetical protein [Micromonospora lupini]MCX5066611.1 hypothetical protein [Micromonospora lupini]
MAVVVAAVVLLSVMAGAAVGFTVGASTNATQSLRALGFTKNSAKLYARAIKILNRMSRVIELDGDFAGDVLSPETKKQVDDLLDDYRKEINR